jgi:VCBS repeat-containing protein
MAKTYKFADLKQALKKGEPAAVINDIVANLSAADINKAVHSLNSGALEQQLFNALTIESLQKVAASLDPSVAAGIANLPPVFLAFAPPSYTDTAAADTFADATGTFQATDLNNNPRVFGLAGGTATAVTIAGISYNQIADSDYGCLLLNTATGAYRFMTDDDAINALSAAANANFTITVSDGTSTVSKAFTVAFSGANDTPIAIADSNAAAEDTVITGSVAGNDSDADAGTSLSYSLNAPVAGLLFNADGSYSFDAGNTAYQHLAAGAAADVVASYTVSDGVGGTATSTLTIHVTGVNDAPLAANDVVSAMEAGGINNGTAGTDPSGNVITGPGADTDIDNAQTSLVIAAVRTGSEAGSGVGGTVGTAFEGAWGSLTLNANGSYSYGVDSGNATVHALAAGESLTDTFTYTMSDPDGLTDTAELTITVNGANDAPLAVDDVLTPQPIGDGWVFNDANGHYYRFVNEAMSWNAAVARAAADGGYLATITSASEQDFVAQAFVAGVSRPADSRPWLGAFSSDAADPASWHWMTGPEAGQSLQYTDWNLGEPNGWENEPAGALQLEPDADSLWNDAPTWFGGRSVLEEFGGMPNTPNVGENGSLTVLASTLLTNDRTSDHGEVLSFASVAALSAHGAAVSMSGGVITYNAASSAALQALEFGQTMTDSFTYAIDDGQGLTGTGTVSLTVSGLNDAPVIVPGGNVSYPASGGPIAIAPTGMISDVDSPNFNGGSLVVVYTTPRVTADRLSIGNQGTGEGQIGVSGSTISFEGAVIGRFSGGASGAALTVTFTTDAATPAAAQALLHDILYSTSGTGFSVATRGLRFTLNDGDGTAGGGSAIGTGTTTINVNQAPETNAVTATGDEDSTIAVSLSGLDADGAVANFRISTLPLNGTLYRDAALSQQINVGASVAATDNAANVYFKPAADWNGSTSFQYAARDTRGLLDASPATGSITVNAVNDAPVAQNDTLSMLDGFVFNPGNGHFYGVTSAASWEQASSMAAAVGGYLATVTSSAENAFIFANINPGGEWMWLGGSDAVVEGQWRWTVGPEAGTQFWHDLYFNGGPVGGNYSNWQPGSEPNGGTGENHVHMWGDGYWNDLGGGSSLRGIVEIGGRPGDAPPFNTDENTPMQIAAATLLANDNDLDDGTLTITGVSATSDRGATVTLGAGGTITYDPTGSASLHVLNGGQVAVDTFTYTVTDAFGASASATVSLRIGGVNDAPVANNQSFTTLEDTSLAGSLTATDVDSDTVTFTILQQPTNGTLTLTAVPGTLTTVAASTFNGPLEHRAGFPAPQNDAQPFDRTNDLAFSGNGFAKAAVARDNIADTNSSLLPIHQAQFANDGYYGNGSSWVANSANDWIKIDLGRDVWINDVLLGRDRTGNFDDRDPGRIQIAVALNDDVYANGNETNDASEYRIVFDSANVGFNGLINGEQTLQAAFASTHARFVKVMVANNGTDLDEVQVFGSVTGPSAPFVYVPNPNANGPDSFTFKAGDGVAADVATVSLNVTAVNDPAVVSSPVLMDRTHHDGSFESNSVFSVNQAPTALPPVWTVTSTATTGGLLSNPPHSTVLAGADGADAIFADGPSTQSTTATSHNLLGGGYSAVHAGDVFAWSFEINSWSATSTGVLKLNFGGGDVIVGTGNAGDNDLATFRTISGTYTATAADAAGGQLHAILSVVTGTPGLNGVNNVYGDNVQISVLSADPVQTLTEGDTAAAISTSGRLIVTDIDSPETFLAQSGTGGSYGIFAIEESGAWTYAASSAHDEFVAGTTYTDTFAVASADGTPASVTINILGTDESPTFAMASIDPLGLLII